MKFNLQSLLVLAILLISSTCASGQVIPERQWPGYRGFMASGVLDNTNLPETFDINKMINVRWKTTSRVWDYQVP